MSQNGWPSHRYTGTDNPAYKMTDLYTIPIDSLNDDFTTNNFLFGHVNGDPHFSSNLVQDSDVFEANGLKYATTRHPPGVPNGTLFRSKSANSALKQPHTFSRGSAPVRSAYPFGTVTKHYLVDKPPRHQQGSKKRACISFFDIETDRVSSYQYRPGEAITGKVTIMIRKTLEIKFVEMIVTGYGKLTIGKSQFPYTARETYLQKEKCIIGAREASMSAVLTPGRYATEFRVQLPAELPSTIHNEDSDNGTTFDITYTIRVRMCDDGDVRSHESVPPQSNKVRVFLEKQINFNVQRGFDLNSIPDSTSPIEHTEQVYLACTHQHPAIVSLNLDRAVFLAGDDIRLQLQASMPSSQSVKEIVCKLQELITLGPKQEPVLLTLSKLVRKNPNLTTGGRLANHAGDDTFSLTMPTHTALVSPYSLGNSKIKFRYFILVELKFSPAGGKLSFKVPVGIGPCADPIYAEKTLSKKLVPLFNRTTRFPCFSSKTLPGSAQLRPSVPRKAASVQVTTKYSNGFFARCFLCCTTAEEF